MEVHLQRVKIISLLSTQHLRFQKKKIDKLTNGYATQVLDGNNVQMIELNANGVTV